jgi:FkbM family methyltransferase
MSLIRDIQRTARFISNHPIARQKPKTAWWRWLQWQLRSRLIKGSHSINWIGGTKLIVDRGMTGATGNIYCGLHEFADMALVIHFLSGQPNPSEALFVDVGANVGSYTILAAGVAGSQAVSIEPTPATFASLSRNVAANSLQNRVTLVQVAVGDQSGEIRFSMDRDCENQVVGANYSGASAVVPLRTIDEILADRSPVMMKMDVEGFEEQALVGATNVLQDSCLQAILLEGVSELSKVALMSAGFVCGDYDPWKRQIVGDSGHRNLGNQLWLRDAQTLESVCKNAPTQAVFGVTI